MSSATILFSALKVRLRFTRKFVTIFPLKYSDKHAVGNSVDQGKTVLASLFRVLQHLPLGCFKHITRQSNLICFPIFHICTK